MTRVVLVELDDAERRARLRHGDRRGRVVRRWCVEELPEVEVDELVAVQREDRALLPPVRGGQAQPAAAAERLGLADRDDLDAEAAQLALELLLVARGAARRSRA